MTEKKNQHWLPQFLLRGFSKDTRSVAALHLPSGRHTPCASIKGQCSKSYLYDRDGSVEGSFGSLEAAAAPTIWQMRVSGRPAKKVLTGAYLHLMVFVSLQYTRTPAAGNRVSGISDLVLGELLKRFQAAGLHMDVDPHRLKYHPERPELFASGMFGDLVDHFYDLEPALLLNGTNQAFCLPDCGVFLFNHWRQSDSVASHLGVGCEGIQIFLPLGPHAALMFYDPKIYNVGKRANRTVTISRPQEVRSFNQLAMSEAIANVYYLNDASTKSNLTSLIPHRVTPSFKLMRAETTETEPGRLVVKSFSASRKITLDLAGVKLQWAARNRHPLHGESRIRAWPSELRKEEAARRQHEEKRAKRTR